MWHEAWHDEDAACVCDNDPLCQDVLAKLHRSAGGCSFFDINVRLSGQARQQLDKLEPGCTQSLKVQEKARAKQLKYLLDHAAEEFGPSARCHYLWHGTECLSVPHQTPADGVPQVAGQHRRHVLPRVVV